MVSHGHSLTVSCTSGWTAGLQYWFQQRSRLIAMVDTWPSYCLLHPQSSRPELACPDDPQSSSTSNKVVQENPAITDWFFYHRIVKFIDVFYVGVLGASDHSLSCRIMFGLASRCTRQVLGSSDDDSTAYCLCTGQQKSSTTIDSHCYRSSYANSTKWWSHQQL